LDFNYGIERDYTLPDGRVITIKSERFRCTEPLFQTELMGMKKLSIHGAAYEAIRRCDDDIKQDLYANIVLAGNSCLFPGISDRFHKEISELAPPSTHINVVPAIENSSWVGGSILASLSSFQTMWISKQQYDEYGPSCVHVFCT